MSLRKCSNEVYVAEGPIAVIGEAEIRLLREAVAATPRGRVRINVHADARDPLHEMFIALSRDSYVRPHRHPGKTEAFHIVEGDVDVVVLDDAGEVRRIVELGQGPGRAVYYRMVQPMFHTLLVKSEILVVHEITNGPFVPGGTQFAPFAPGEDESTQVAAYRVRLARQVADFSLAGTR
jgi:cupin fold WbuC family metalloprotein